MVTMKDIMNMGRKIKRSNNPKTLAKYQAQIDAWIAELAADQARTQTELQALDEKIKLEEEAKAHQGARTDLPAYKSEKLDSKEQAKKIAEKAGVSPRKSYHYFEFERFHLRRSRA